MKTKLTRVCVYCGSSSRVNQSYLDAARELGMVIAQHKLTLVYGGANVGCMGAIADAALAAGGDVIGVIPKGLVEKEVAHQGLTELHIVDDMHQRKALMAELSDAFIAAPGGLGTLEELFEMATWAQLGFHTKPMGLYNVNHFFDGLVGFLSHARQEGFLADAHLSLFNCEQSPKQLIEQLETQASISQDKWW
ncbi:MAG: TIGR00730 family Rossman fold protein [Gammaproteobacteria bacterium]|nr:TIGR00730 family Rossman fold protein [Gammaproteobacteria bacterium]